MIGAKPMTDGAAIREQIDRQIRPGQVDTATVASRTPSAQTIGSTQTTNANRYDWDESANYQYALYGRSRYGGARYREIT